MRLVWSCADIILDTYGVKADLVLYIFSWRNPWKLAFFDTDCWLIYQCISSFYNNVACFRQEHSDCLFEVHTNALKHASTVPLLISLEICLSRSPSQTQMKSWWWFSVLQKLGWPKFIKVIFENARFKNLSDGALWKPNHGIIMFSRKSPYRSTRRTRSLLRYLSLLAGRNKNSHSFLMDRRIKCGAPPPQLAQGQCSMLQTHKRHFFC